MPKTTVAASLPTTRKPQPANAAARKGATPRMAESFQKLKLICNALDEEKARDIRVLDVRAVTMIADYFVICTGTSSVHINAITEGVQEGLRDEGFRARPEGKPGSSWTLLDYGDVIAHVFSADLRDLYDLERLWCDAVATDWQPEAA